MKLLLDTHVVLWALSDPDRLSADSRALLLDPDNDLGVSAATAWEVAIKRHLGKLEMPGTVSRWFLRAVTELGGHWLPVRAKEAALVEGLPDHHRDPFDRILIAQAMELGRTVITADEVFAAYPVAVLRA